VDIASEETIGRSTIDWWGSTKRAPNAHVVETIDAAGLGVLADLAAQASESKRGLRLSNVPKRVSEVIALTHLADVLECYPTEKDGLASYLGIAAFWRASYLVDFSKFMRSS